MQRAGRGRRENLHDEPGIGHIPILIRIAPAHDHHIRVVCVSVAIDPEFHLHVGHVRVAWATLQVVRKRAVESAGYAVVPLGHTGHRKYFAGDIFVANARLLLELQIFLERHWEGHGSCAGDRRLGDAAWRVNESRQPFFEPLAFSGREFEDGLLYFGQRSHGGTSFGALCCALFYRRQRRGLPRPPISIQTQRQNGTSFHDVNYRRQPTNLRALRNSRIQPLYSPASRGRQEFWM